METHTVNVHPIERTASVVLGGVLLWRGITRRTAGETAIAAVLLYRGIRGQSYLYKAFHINTAPGNKLQGMSDKAGEQRTITIRKSAEELYRIWQEPQNAVRIMGDSATITPIADKRLHWQVRGPLGTAIEWDTEVIEEQPGRLIRWHTPEGALIPNEGSIAFRRAPKDWGTEVTLQITFTPVGGAVGKKVASSVGILPRLFLEKVLRRFKSLVETGEIASLQDNPSARHRDVAYTH